ncbi:MAG: hypothetical protein JXA78_17005 [Anaerolineales bacterium]|nr:hypothetical protein [Anaerolineales bacterium]
MIYPDNLFLTLDSLNEAFFTGRTLSQADRERSAEWIASRQRQSGRYAGLFVPDESGPDQPFHLFSGEKLRTCLAARNVLSAEAARAITLLEPASPAARQALARARESLARSCFAAQLCVLGECAHSGVGWMRCLAAWGSDEARQRLHAHVENLSQHRNGEGRWRRFPFYYTLLALTETGLPSAAEEIRYVAPTCERLLKREADGAFAARRKAILERALAAC